MYNRGGARGGGGRPVGGRSGGLLGRSPNKQREDGRQAGQMSTGMKRMLGGGGNNSGLLGSAPRQRVDNSMAYNVDQSYNQHSDQQYDQGYGQGDSYAGTQDYRREYGLDVNAEYGTQHEVYATPEQGQLNHGGQRYAKGQGRQGFQGGQPRQGYNNGQRRLPQSQQGLQSGQGTRQDVGMGHTRQAYQPEEVYNDYNETDYLDQDYGGVGVEGAIGEDYSGGWDAYGGDRQAGGGLLPVHSARNFPPNQGGNSQKPVPRNNRQNREIGNRPRIVGRGKQARSSEQRVGGAQEPTDTYSLLSQASRGRGLLNQQAHLTKQPGLLGQPSLGRGRGPQGQPRPGGRIGMNPDQQGMMSTQADLMQKAEMQMRMIQQEEEREAVMMQQKLLREQEQIEEQRRAEEMQALLETQQRAMMLQQNDRQMRMGAGAGLLGDRPIQGGSPGGLAPNRNRQGPGIPSIFDVRGPGKPSQLGKRPSLTVARANIAAKRARQESQNRNANKPRRSSPTRRGRDKSRGGQRKSRFEQSQSSKHHDRKESESHKSSSGQKSSGKDHSRSRGRDSRSDDKTEVKVTAEAYDPANPTGDTDMKSPKSDDDVKVTGVEGPRKGTESKEEKEVPMETNLTVTFSKKGRSVNDSDSKGDQDRKELERKYKCNVCDVKCFDEESFSRHMNGLKHKNKMEKLTTTSNQTTPLLVARKQAEEHLRQIEMKRGFGQSKPPGKTLESHCKVCNEMFTGAYKDHKEVPKHQAKEDRRKAGCKVCKVESFNSYGDFLKHLDSAWHKKNKKQSGEADGPDDLGDLVTLDTVGFEEESQSEIKTEPKPDVTATAPAKTVEPEDIELGEYEPSKAVGQELVITVWGFFCKLCHKFYNNESAAKGSHCQSQAHFEKYKKYLDARKLKRQLSNGKGAEGEKGESSGTKQDASSQPSGQTTGGEMSQSQSSKAEGTASDTVYQSSTSNDESSMQQDNQGDTDTGTANESTLTQSDIQEDMETSDTDSKVGDENEIKIEILTKTKGGPSPRGAPVNRGRRGGGRRQPKKKV